MLPGSSFFGWQGGANEEAAEYALKYDKPAKVNAWQKLFGATDDDAENILLRRQQKDLNRKYGAQMAALGLTGADWREDEQAVMAKIAKRTEERQIGQRNRTESIEAKKNSETIQATKDLKGMDIQAQNDRFAFQTKIEGMRNSHQASESAKDRALERTLANNSDDLKMQMAFMNADLEEKRMEYNRETQRLDRRDRQIAQLMRGLGQLGAAFA